MRRRQQHPIMVAVQALDRSSGQLLRKAAALARDQGCGLDLVHVIALPYAPAISRRANMRQAVQDVVADSKARLHKLAAGRELRGIPTKTTVTWDYPAADGIVRQVLRRRPQMLLAEAHRHTRLTQAFLGATDCELTRECPCDVLIVKPRGFKTRVSPRPRLVTTLPFPPL